MPNFNPEASKVSRIIEYIVLMTSFGCIITCLFIGMACIYNSPEAIFRGELVPKAYYSYYTWGIAISVFHSFQLVTLSVNLAITTNLIIIYLFYVTLLLTQELCLGRKSYRTLNFVRECQNIQCEYRTMQVLQAYAMELFGPFFIFFHCSLTDDLTLCCIPTS